MENLKVLFVAQEITPYLPETEIATVCRTLPQGIQEKGREIRTFMPRFGCVNERRNQLHEVIRLSGMNLIINETDHPLIIKVASIQSARMQVYFIDNEDYFGRKQTFREDNGAFFPDNDERAVFYARGVLETVRKLRWNPDIVHCHGWFTGLVPMYVKKSFREDPIFSKARVVYSLYQDSFAEPFAPGFAHKAHLEGVSKKDLSTLSEENYIGLSKLAVQFADGVLQISPEVHPSLLRYVQDSGKPFVDGSVSPETLVDVCSDFYDRLIHG
jgi:starch synthase